MENLKVEIVGSVHCSKCEKPILGLKPLPPGQQNYFPAAKMVCADCAKEDKKAYTCWEALAVMSKALKQYPTITFKYKDNIWLVKLGGKEFRNSIPEDAIRECVKYYAKAEGWMDHLEPAKSVPAQ